VEDQVHLAEEVRQRLGLAAKQRLFLQETAVGHGFDLLPQNRQRMKELGAGGDKKWGRFLSFEF
jgi:hypothetical protein